MTLANFKSVSTTNEPARPSAPVAGAIVVPAEDDLTDHGNAKRCIRGGGVGIYQDFGGFRNPWPMF